MNGLRKYKKQIKQTIEKAKSKKIESAKKL
jgi:hypothetical protein